jgi:hypothetical protein
MSLFEDVGPKRLLNLLDEINRGVSALPDFQRSFVWDPQDIVGLLVSVGNGYPAGSILRVRDTEFAFQSRIFEGADESPIEPRHTYLILDGQQRLTSLYQAMFGRGSYRFFLDIRRVAEGADLGDGETLFFERANSRRAQRLENSLRDQVESRVFPFSALVSTPDGFAGWLFQALEEVSEDERIEFREHAMKVNNSFFDAIRTYEFPVVTLSSRVSVDALCTIFETINRTGVKLSLFELMTARFFKHGVNLRTKWEEAVDLYPLFGESKFALDPYYLLQAISMTVNDPPTCKRKDILNLTFEQLESTWDQVCDGMNRGLELLRDDCRIVNRRWLPTPSMLGPLAALMTIDRPANVVGWGDRKQFVKKWIWCAIFGQRYEAAANTRAEKDVFEMTRWMRGGPVPSMIDSFDAESVPLREASTSSAPVYKGVICLTLLNGARDFAHHGPITEQMIAQGEVDDHHVFPKKYLEDRGEPKARINCVLNRTLIDPETNRRISSNPPSVYLPRLNLEEDENQILASHHLPGGADSPLLSNDFERFLVIRESRLRAAIAAVTR